MPVHIGFNQGQYGDLFIGLTACRVVKRADPDCKLVYSVNKKFKDIIPILKLSKDIDGFILWEGYNNWPTELDSANLQKAIEGCGTDNFHLFHPMQTHTVYDWYNYWHQTEEVCVAHQLLRPAEEEMDFKLNKPEIKKENTITICPSRRIENEGNQNPKALTIEQIELVKQFGIKNNLKVIQISGPQEEQIEGLEKFEGNYSESVIKVLQSRFLVAADTGMIWAASAFSHPVVGLYDLSYYKAAVSCKNWTPKNKNQITLFSNKIGDISLPTLEEALVKKHNENIMNPSYSKEHQDLFAKKLIGEDGFFLDIGCDHPSKENNTKLLEEIGWDGLAFDIGPHLESWKLEGRRATTYNVDASSDGFIDILKAHEIKEVDYISLDIDEDSFSCLKNLILADIQFKCMTFEHTWNLHHQDVNCVEDSRKLLTEHGYKLLFKNVRIEANQKDGHGLKPFEDWWVNQAIYDRYGETYENIIHSDTVKIL